MLNGVGMGNANMKRVQLVKRLLNHGYNLQVSAINSLKEFLEYERQVQAAAEADYLRQQNEKDRILRRILDSNLRMCGVGFRQALRWMEAEREKERVLINKQRGIMRRIVDKNSQMISAGYNKLMEEAKIKQAMLKTKLKFVLKALTDTDASMVLAAYNGMKQRCLMLNGVGQGNAEMKKVSFIKNLMNKGNYLQVSAVNSLKEYLRIERDNDERRQAEYERKQKEKDRILKRIMDSNLRMCGIGFRQAFKFMESNRENEKALINKQRGVMLRILDRNARFISAGYNKLMEEAKKRRENLQRKMKFVLKALTDTDASTVLAAYNGMKQRCLMLNGVGQGNAEMKKVSFIKNLMNKGNYLQVSAVNSLKEYLRIERDNDERRQAEYERKQKEKDRILKRIMDSNLRMCGIGFRQAFKFMESNRENEKALINKQRGVMLRILDRNTRLMGMGYNKLVEETKNMKQVLQNKLRFVLKSLTDIDSQMMIAAYNGMKEQRQL